MNSFYQLLLSMSFIVPFLLIFSAGIILSLVNLKKMRKAAIFALIGFFLLLLNSLSDIINMTWLLFYANQSSADSVSSIMMIKGIVSTILSIAGFIFLLAAIFVKRVYSKPDLGEN